MHIGVPLERLTFQLDLLFSRVFGELVLFSERELLVCVVIMDLWLTPTFISKKKHCSNTFNIFPSAGSLSYLVITLKFFTFYF